MKILHTADIHLGELNGPIIDGENARMMDTVRCMNFIEDKALEENVDIIVISGDLFNKSKLWADEMLKEITIASNWLRALCSIAPTVLMWGTGNHDSMAAFENIRKMNIDNLTVVTEPKLLEIYTQSGSIQVAVVPGMDKGYFRALFPGMDMEDENKAISKALGNVILGIGMDAVKAFPLILMSHYTVMGSTTGNGEALFMNSDIIIPTEALEASNYDLVCLGHIHKAQSIPNCGRPVYYSGPPNAISFNEEGQRKGFYIHDFNDESMQLNSRFINTPSREFVTLEMSELDIEYFTRNGRMVIEEGHEAKNKIVRVIYSCSDEVNKQFSKKSLEKALYAAGAFYISEIRPSKIIATVDKNALNENDSVENNLKFWLEKQEVPAEEIIKIIEVARPMISTVSASLPTGKLSGVFEPVRLAVKNYRSYLEEEFDFTKISFATVNGPNGIGKSSFFMDAMADCLYEQPREGELTGWISNNPEIKSGAMTFEFLMGKDTWRVIRTRVKSGKTTLALQRYVETEWKDFSEDNKTQTQEKILNLLGMDALTFKSCALIMQDNYGVFLEADKTDRMQVLGNILGLNIYDKLHVIAKEDLKVQNRNIEKLKSSIAELDTKINTKVIYENKLEVFKKEKILTEQQIVIAESKLKQANFQVEKYKNLMSQIAVISEKVETMANEINNKESEMLKLDEEKKRAENITGMEEEILSKITEYETTRDKMTTLRARQPLVNNKRSEVASVKLEVSKNNAETIVTDKKISALEVDLKCKKGLELEVASLDALEKALEVMDKEKLDLSSLEQEQSKALQEHKIAQKNYDNKLEKIESELNSCKRKAELIENSNCPIEKPTCNFLKDAMESKSKIESLEKDKKDCEFIDFNEGLALSKNYRLLTEKVMAHEYNPITHQITNKRIVEIRKQKEQLLSLSGKDEMLKNELELQSELRKKLGSLNEKLATLENEYSVLQLETTELETLESSLPTLERWYKGKDELPAAKQSLINTKARLEVLVEEIKNKQILSIAEKAKKSKLSEDVFLIKTNDPEPIESELKGLRRELTTTEVNIGIANSKLLELKNYDVEMMGKAKELKEYASRSSNLSLLVKAFSIDGVPFQIVRSAVPELSAQANEILSQMTGGKMSIEMKMDKILKNKSEVNALEIWISDYQRGTMPYLSRSGGQKVKAALSVAFSLADLKANRAGIQLGMMFIDEPPFLDGDGVQAYCDALELIHNRYPNMRVVAISHDPAMKARFPQEIEVVNTGDGGSKIIFNN
ncbi:exonuclease subunit SbcD [Clostridium estertheticum]|uniref:exonuclease subunit SbcD n=1 Tax=Clostridium estertheticum TaxID=238834 RepID=UPI001C0D5F98|nr:exonuclease subunit SbcD [Clostridium estertheticum]MBU3176067.1 exonuclease subunit SbcD [Clostridium estertheticum]